MFRLMTLRIRHTVDERPHPLQLNILYILLVNFAVSQDVGPWISDPMCTAHYVPNQRLFIPKSLTVRRMRARK